MRPNLTEFMNPPLCGKHVDSMFAKISDSVLYIGTDDRSLDLFESQYPVPAGMSYNSYVLLDDKIAVLDTADAREGSQWMTNLEEALEGRCPDYLVVHHLEPDHSAMIAAVAEKYPSMTIVCSQIAARMLPQFFDGTNFEGRCLVVGEGDGIDLGRHSLKFFMAPMVHWPEVMVSWLSGENLLFSADAFGTFGTVESCGGLFCSDLGSWKDEAARYYFNICGKYGAQVGKLLDKVASLDVSAICPLHGPVIRDVPGAAQMYRLWSSYAPETDAVLVAYASIHGGTAALASKLAELLEARGKKVILRDLSRRDVSYSVSDAFRCSRVVFAASSYDAGVFPPMHDFLWHLQIKGWQGRKVAVVQNGSWSPTAGRAICDMLSAMKNIETVADTMTIRSRMHSCDLPALESLADAIAE